MPRLTARLAVLPLALLVWPGTACKTKHDDASDKPSSASTGEAASKQTTKASAEAPTAREQVSPAAFLKGGAPTFVLGTDGDARAQRLVRAQVDLMRALSFRGAKKITDGELLELGRAKVPPRLTVYGGPHINTFVAKHKGELPLRITESHIEIGDESYEGPVAISAVVPESASHPSFWLLAGTGTPGISEINAQAPLHEPIAILDAFGVLATGEWERHKGTWRARMNKRAPRPHFRTVSKTLKTESDPLDITFAFPDDYGTKFEDTLIEKSMKGFERVITKLKISHPLPLTVYAYPSRKSMVAGSGFNGNGVARPYARALHIEYVDAIESLIAHEGSHVLMGDGPGAPSEPLMGEGVAVWVSGQYGGKTVAEWATTLESGQKVTDFFGAAFRKFPEAKSYPLGALVVDVLVKKVGFEKFSKHLIGTTGETWEADCKAAGTSSDEVQEEVDKRLRRAP